MSEESYLITRPANARGLYIPQEYIAICKQVKTRKITRGERKGEVVETIEYNLAAAAVLRMVERWTHWALRQLHRPPREDDYWRYMSQSQMEEFELVNSFGKTQIDTGIKLLLKLGFLSRRNNPYVPFDRTYQYRFETARVQEAIDGLPPFDTIEQWKNRNRKMEQQESEVASSESGEAIPQVPTQVPTQENTKDSLADATAPQDAPIVDHPAPPDNAPTAGQDKPKKKRKPDALFDAVAARLFHAEPGSPEVGAVSGRVGRAKKALVQLDATPDEFEEACVWWRRTKQIDLPKDAEKVAGMMIEFRAHRAHLDAAAQAFNADPDDFEPPTLTPTVSYAAERVAA